MKQHGRMGLKKRRITLKDGRYMIFYASKDESVEPPPEGHHNERSEPEPAPQTKDERGV